MIWRSLDELAAVPAFQSARHNEFPPGATEPPVNRRDFLKLMAASMALASLPACTRQPIEKIVPYVKQPEELVPGNPLFYATAMTLGGFASGLMIESHEGHPTKIEGNPGHPSSLGATNVLQQAALLDLYDPDRSQTVLNHGQPSTWESFATAFQAQMQSVQANHGRGVHILTETISSPTLRSQLQTLLGKYPEARWHQYEPVNRDNAFAGARLAFGEAVEMHCHFDRAKVILSLDSDFLYGHPDNLRHALAFADGRRAQSGRADMNRLYVVESSASVTGSNADHRLPLNATGIARFAYELATRLGLMAAGSPSELTPETRKWIYALADDLLQNEGTSLVIAGENQPPDVHVLAHNINDFLGNIGHTVTFTEPVINPASQIESLRDLIAALHAGSVETLLILGGNPTFTAPADFDFPAGLLKAKSCIHLSTEVNETSALCEWHIPQNHFLESWSDGRAFDGTVSIVQPLILPLYAGKSAHEVLDVVTLGRSDYDIVHDFWSQKMAGLDFEKNWRQALHDGYFANTRLPEKRVSLRTFQITPVAQKTGSLEITFSPDPNIHDGRFANNAWLQELPQPVTKLTWDNAALLSPGFAAKEGLANGDIVDLELNGRRLSLPVWITPGQPDDSIALHFGGGRSHVGRVGKNAGFNTYTLRTSDSLYIGRDVRMQKTGGHYPLVTTQTQHAIDSEERQIFREGTFADFKADPEFAKKSSETPIETLFKPEEFKTDGYRWGMAIDLTACIGCNACILACQSENNIPVVGKDQVSKGRIMHWIRVDTYFRGTPENPDMNHQPVPCMQCENAPCELVCPVGATVHDKEGLNLQVYNRCVGTRYCSNNCPYKVRRFNFFQYADYHDTTLKPLWNPNVTVRSRGVMEKCTYCIQRISMARIGSEEQGHKIQDGQLKTACQQVCPARAIVFGDIGDPKSAVSKLKANNLNFSMLGELNTRPRTTYLAKLRNPNPQLTT
ncbi:MAG TPA: TAT-variant-translocated molybdopterin oxidoreductase [Verrucomicrobiae bacterium]|nr:TAT-variant-translocated molybdopterin oxidoreductase [Verrucomicrobiae bacterium]